MTLAIWTTLAALVAMPAPGEHATADEVQAAKVFFANAVNGVVPDDLDVSITDGTGNRRFEAGELSRTLSSCFRRTTFTSPIFNPDGSLTPGVHYVTMDLDDCKGHEGGVAIFEFRSGTFARFMFHAGQYRIAKKKTN